MSVVSHLVDAVFFVLTAMALYILLEHVHKSMARAMLVFVAVAVGIITLNAVFQFEGLQVATNASYVTAFGAAGSMPSCCSCWTFSTMGPLPHRSSLACGWRRSGILPTNQGIFPKALGVTLVAATVCYLVHLITAFLVPGSHEQIQSFLVIVPTIAEIWMVLYLLVVGVKRP